MARWTHRPAHPAKPDGLVGTTRAKSDMSRRAGTMKSGSYHGWEDRVPTHRIDRNAGQGCDAMRVSFPWLWAPLVRRWSAHRTLRRRSRTVRVRALEGLELRWALSALPVVQMLSASTSDSKSVTIEYRINQVPDPGDPVHFGIYRSSDGQFDSSDSLIATATLSVPASAPAAGAVTVDASGGPATRVGAHRLTIPVPQGLPPVPRKPFVLVVANPGSPSAYADARQTSAFRVETIGIVTHGGMQNPSWKHGPPWELITATLMRREGFDAVIPYNWVRQSSTPGSAIKQSSRLAHMILDVAARFPRSNPVDLEFVGHSEGTVVNTYAIVALEREMTPEIQSGYVVDIVLDPHAANNNVPGQQMSAGGMLGGIARAVVTGYQARANDPPVFIPAAVDEADVFFQHSQAAATGIYNLWGQVPVKSNGVAVHYYNLTAMGATHSGKTGVNYWFANFVAPSLGNHAPLIHELELNGQIDRAETPGAAPSHQDAWVRRTDKPRSALKYGPAHVVETRLPEFSGTAAPGSIVRLKLGPAATPTMPVVAGVTTATATGEWFLTPRHPIRNGWYRTLVTAFSRELATRPGLAIVPTQPLGRLVVDAPTA